MNDDTDLHPLELLHAYGIALHALEARIARMKAEGEDWEPEGATSDMLTLGICAIVSECGPSVVIEPEQSPASFAS